jgi:hypothetical protein
MGRVMSRWFRRVDNRPGFNKALLAGFAGAVIATGIDAYRLVSNVSWLQQPDTNGIWELKIGLLISGIAWTLLAIIAAWRFAIGKGLVWGSALLLFFVVLPLVGDFFVARTPANIDWGVARSAVGAALIAGIYGAWAARGWQPTPDYGEVFE